MKSGILTVAAIGFIAATTFAIAQQTPMPRPVPAPTTPVANIIMTSVPAGSLSLTEWYKQHVYDSTNAKIGEISDVLVAPSDGKITAIIIGVGGFLGMGEKEIAVPFDALRRTLVDNATHLTLDTTKDALKAAPGFKYDRKTSTWTVAQAAAN